jgi:hypothetical protein
VQAVQLLRRCSEAGWKVPRGHPEAAEAARPRSKTLEDRTAPRHPEGQLCCLRRDDMINRNFPDLVKDKPSNEVYSMDYVWGLQI